GKPAVSSRRPGGCAPCGQLEWRLSMRRWLALVAGIALVLGLLPATATAQTAGALVASGLNNPRGIAVASDGTIYVAESGTGGAEQINLGPPFGSGPRGTTAQITRISTDGSKRA